MPLFDRLPLRTARQRRAHGGAVTPRRWWRRHPVLSSLTVLVVVGGVLAWLRPWWSPPPCGPGLTEAGPPQVCVGIDLDSTALRDNDPLADLEQRIANQNAQITGDNFVTVVVLDDMTPDPQNDSLTFQSVRRSIQGAITAAWRANNQSVAGGTTPPVKLLLANFGSGGKFWPQAVDAIVAARDSQHIVAVTDFGQSLVTSRKAASALSDQRIASVGALTSGDEMNRNPDTGQYIQRFFRVTPTDTDAAKAAASYLATKSYQRVMLVQDTNAHDLYAASLATAFQAEYNSKYPNSKTLYTQSYASPDTPLNDINRATYMTSRFADMHGEICLERPDLIYFAGRGADLGSFLAALAGGGACGLSSVDVLTSDDATSILGRPLPNFGNLQVKVLYTGVAAKDEWNNAGQPDNEQNYNAFVSAFTGQQFGTTDELVDGYAMMNHDAVLTAATAARRNPSPVANPATVADFIGEFNCRNPIPGASGKIAFTQDSHGNPIDKAMAIMQIQPDGSPKLQDLTWATGQPFDPAACR